MVILLNILWMLVSVFLILVILVQRGRGGGLVGALGGMGGSSAFGTRAGDVFTRITVVVFVVWLVIGVVLVPLMTQAPKYREEAAAAAPGAEAGSTPPPSDDMKGIPASGTSESGEATKTGQDAPAPPPGGPSPDR